MITVHLDEWILEGQDPVLTALVAVEIAFGPTVANPRRDKSWLDGGWVSRLRLAQCDAAVIAHYRPAARAGRVTPETLAVEAVDLARKRVGFRAKIEAFLRALPEDLAFVITGPPEAIAVIARAGLPVGPCG